MKEIQRICLKVEASIATLLAEHDRQMFDSEKAELERAMKAAREIRGRAS